MEGSFHIDCGAVPCGGLESPLRDGLTGELVKAVIDTAENSDIAHTAIGVNDCVKNNCSSDILTHQLQRICRINFTRGGGGGKVIWGSNSNFASVPQSG